MILYCILTNAGGMKRIHDHLVLQKNIIVAFLSHEKIKEARNKYWIHCPALTIEEHAKSNFDLQLRKLNKIILKHKITGVICDYPSALYIQKLNVPFILDVHTLGRPLYSAITTSPKRLQLNALLKYPEIAANEMLMYAFLKQEHSIVNQARAFISNSKNTSRFLRKDYRVNKALIYELPVTTKFSKKLPQSKLKNTGQPYGLVFGRWHPQKGLENILLHDWRPLNIVVRGLDSKIFKNDVLKKFEAKGLSLRPWTNSDATLVAELQNAQFVLFPSLYEPYGLALHEALAMGCICIAHKNNSGHEEQICHGDNGFLLDMSDEKVVENVKKILIQSAAKRSQISKRAKKNKFLNHKERDKKFQKMLAWAKSQFAGSTR